MSEGLKHDDGKLRIDLFPGDALFAISQILTFGAKKYTARNWENGIAWGRVFGATMRHLWSWWQGRGPTNQSFLFGDLDTESGFSHLWHAGCCIVFLIAYEMRGMTTFDDRPVRAELTKEHWNGDIGIALCEPEQHPAHWTHSISRSQYDPS
jgi:hypothetical protein